MNQTERKALIKQIEKAAKFNETYCRLLPKTAAVHIKFLSRILLQLLKEKGNN